MANMKLCCCLCTLMCFFLGIFQMRQCNARVTGCYVLPHGGIALDPTYFNTTNSTSKEEAWTLHHAAKQLGHKIRKQSPDIIFLSTPHGIADLKDFVLFLNSEGYGIADTDNCACPPCCYNISVPLDSDVSQDIVHELRVQHKLNVSGLTGFGAPGNNEQFPLRWGEVIPLYFTWNSSQTKVVILSQPTRRYNDSMEMIPELLRVGGTLYKMLHSSPKRVAVVISADLAHTHDKDGPYGYSPTAEPFDQACGKWASELDEGALLDVASILVDYALSCGYTGLVMLHGLLRASDLSLWKPHVYANLHPSYYGMMVAEFLPKTG
ncbi:protein TTE1956-like [Glandiceps talaboti]